MRPMTFTFKRADWVDPRRPVTGPAFSWSKIDKFIGHYRGAGAGRPVPKDVGASLRASHHGWLDSRGYSYGYNVVVVSSLGHPHDGTSWEIRGDTFRSAATAGANIDGFAVQIMQVDDERLTPKALAEVRRLVAEVRLRSSLPVTITGHGFPGVSTTRTSCPGKGITHEIRAGLWEPTGAPPKPEPKPEPPPAPTPEPDPEDDMTPTLWQHPRYGIWWMIVGADILPAIPDDYRRAEREGWPRYVEAHEQRLTAALHRNGLSVADLPVA